MSSMRRHWKTLEQRFAGLSLRERSLLAAAVLALIYMVLDATLISPAVLKQKSVSLDVAQKRQQVDTLQAQARVLKAEHDQNPEAAASRQLERLRAQLAELRANVREQSALLVPVERMPRVLEQLLAKHPRVELADLRTLPRRVLDLDEAKASSGAAAVKAARDKEEADDKPVIYRHGLEISLRGRYLDLLEYLRAIEAQPYRLYWQRMDLVVTEYPIATLKLTLYTLSPDSEWMKV